jgi:hypothetical protein
VLLGVAGAPSDLWAYSSLPAKLPPGVYRMPQDLPEAGRQQALLGWMLGEAALGAATTGSVFCCSCTSTNLHWHFHPCC